MDQAHIPGQDAESLGSAWNSELACSPLIAAVGMLEVGGLNISTGLRIGCFLGWMRISATQMHDGFWLPCRFMTSDVWSPQAKLKQVFAEYLKSAT